MHTPALVVEASAYALFIASLGTAARRGAWDLGVVLAAALFGLAIEWMFVHFAGGYEYGEFLVMLWDAPLWVACGWGFIIYASCRTAEEIDLKAWGKPPAAALMATSLDLALDPVAEGLDWWHWKRPDPGFFGVSYDNFTGWLLIVGSFSAFTLLWRQFWGPWAALPAAVGVVAACTPILEVAYRHVGEGPVFYGLWMTLLFASLQAQRLKVAWYRVVVPVYLHGLFLALLVGTGLVEQHPELYGVFALAGSVSLLWFLREGRHTPSAPDTSGDRRAP